MKSVLISIKPKWVEKICKGEKTIEVRKTKPKFERPFKCYIYQTIGGGVKGDIIISSGLQCGKVIGEFTCDKIYDFPYKNSNYFSHYNINIMENACLTLNEIHAYGNGKTLYGLDISDLKIYDKPKELSEFRKCEWYCKLGETTVSWCIDCNLCNKGRLTRPPQSWFYVEDLGEE